MFSFQISLSEVEDDIADEKYELRRADDKALKSVIKANIADLKAVKSQLRDESAADIAVIDQQIQSEKDRRESAEQATKTQREEIKQQIKDLKAMRKGA